MEIESQESFDVGNITNEEARIMLKKKRNGTFLVRYSTNKGCYFLNCKNPGDPIVVQITFKENYYFVQVFLRIFNGSRSRDT